MAVKQWFPYSRQIIHVMKCAVSEWLEHRAASKGAALAYYTLFSLAPILVLVIAIAGFFYGAEAAQGQLFNELRGLVGAQGADTIQAILAGARNKDSGLMATIIATVLLLVGATSVFAELKDSLDEIWDVPPPKDASWWDTVRRLAVGGRRRPAEGPPRLRRPATAPTRTVWGSGHTGGGGTTPSGWRVVSRSRPSPGSSR